MAGTRVKKTMNACDSCRKRKRKCDGGTPICSLCERGNHTCVYEVSSNQSRPMQKSYIAALEARVALLEGILKDDTENPEPAAEEGELAQIDTTIAAQTTEPASSLVSPPQSPENGSESAFVPADDAANALKHVSLTSSEQGTSEPLDGLNLNMVDWVPLVSLDAEHKLLSQFWDWQRLHLPFVAPVPFLSAYAIHSEIAHPNEPIPPLPLPPTSLSGPTFMGVPRAASVKPSADLIQFISPLLLDAMFAIAALFSGDPETSDMFYRRAKTRVLSESANPRLATVQGMLAMITWEQGYARAPSTLTLTGVACALCVRLGMNIDTTQLVSRGTMSQRLYDTRNFVFWSTYITDRTIAACIGMQPFIDRRGISTPHRWSFATANGVESHKLSTTSNPPTHSKLMARGKETKPTRSYESIDWWNPGSLGIGDVIIEALWEAICDLNQMADRLIDEIYAVSERTPQEDLELVTRNHLEVQRFLDELPTWLRSTGALRKKDSNLVYLHLFIHVFNVIASRPFISPRPLSEDAMRTDSTTDPNEPTHSSHIIRRYRALAFRVARASALQIMSLIRHVPLSSPCVTIPYLVYAAATILLLTPEDLAAMDAVRTGIACLECMDETGYWVNSAKSARDRIQALANRWGVNLVTKGKPLGHIESGGYTGQSSGRPGAGERTTRENQPESRSGGSSPNSPPRIDGYEGYAGIPSSTTFDQPAENPNPTILCAYIDDNSQSYSEPLGTIYLNKAMFDQISSGSGGTGATTHQSHTADPVVLAGYNPQANMMQSNVGVLANPTVRPAQMDAYIQLQALAYQIRQPACSKPQPHVEPQPPTQHTHYHIHSHTYFHPDQPLRETSCTAQYQPNRLPHVAYHSSHADPRHDIPLAHTHWHDVVPPTDPNFPFLSDPTACTDISTCFSETVRNGQDPAFIQTMADPYADVSLHWFADQQQNFLPNSYGGGKLPGAVY